MYCDFLVCARLAPCPVHLTPQSQLSSDSSTTATDSPSTTASSAASMYMHMVVDKKQHQMRAQSVSPELTPTVSARPLKEPLAGCVLSNVLTREECVNLRQELQQQGFQYEFWNMDAPEKKDMRNADTIEVLDEHLASVLWQRISPHLKGEEKKIVIIDDNNMEEADDRFECGLEGEWVACGINPVMLYGRYLEDCHFSPHSDGNNVIDFNNRSLFTVLVYLTDCLDGGSTNLFQDSQQQLEVDSKGRKRFPAHAITDFAQVRMGNVLIFRQDHLHEGEPVGKGCEKVIIRTDVMFTRVPPACNDQNGLDAYALYLKAQSLEGEGKFAEASFAYKQASKLCPQLAKMLRFV